jgi:hypothetical protein
MRSQTFESIKRPCVFEEVCEWSWQQLVWSHCCQEINSPAERELVLQLGVSLIALESASLSQDR